MFPNFNAERARVNLTLQDIADKTGQTVSSVSAKLSGKAKLSFGDAVAYKEAVGTELPLEVLFMTCPLDTIGGE